MLRKTSENNVINLTDIRVIIEETQEEQLINIDFYAQMPVLESSLNNPQSGWMFNKDFRSSLNIYVIEINDTSIYNSIKKLDATEAAKVLYKNKADLAHSIIGPPKLTERQILSLSKFKDNGGNEIYKVPFKAEKPRRIKKTQSLETLVYYFLPVLDQGNEGEEASVGSAFKKEVILSGRKAETTKQFSKSSNSTSSKTSVMQGHHHSYYIDENGNGWATSAYSESGEYNPYAQHKHKIIDGRVQAARSVVTGKIHEHALEDVNSNLIENIGVLDNRNINKPIANSKLASGAATNIQLPLLQTNAGIVPKGVIKPSARRVDTTISNSNVSSPFSELTLSKDENNNNNMIFALNFNSLVKQSSFLTSLPNNNSLKDLFISNSKILSLKLYRTRLDATSGPNTTKTDANEPFLVAQSSDNNSKKLITNKRYVDFQNNDAGKNTLDRRDNTNVGELVGSVSEIMIQNTNTGIRQFSCVDNSAAKLTNGKFKYYIEVEVTDPLPETFQGFVNTLISNRTQIESYLASASEKKKNTSFNFDPLANRFKANFIRVFYENQLEVPMIKILEDYVRILSYFQDTSGISNSSLYGMIDPRTATLESIRKILELQQKLITTINQILGKDRSGTGKRKAKDGALGTSAGQNSEKRKIKVNKHFVNDIFTRDLTQQRSVGYDLLGQQTLEEGGIKSVSVSNMNTRFDKELAKVSIQPGQTTLQVSDKSYVINKVGELTPDRILIAGRNNLVPDSQDKEQNQNANLLITQVNQRQQTRKELLKDKKLQTSREVLKWAHNTNITVISLQSEMLEQLEGADVVDVKTGLTGSGADTKELRLQMRKRKEESIKPGILTKIYNSFFDTNITNKNNKFVKKIEEHPAEELQRLPYHTVALASQVSGSGPVDYPKAYQNYVNMYKVEVFKGYEESKNGDKLTLSPKYEELTDMSEVKGNTLARLVPYENIDINIKQEENLKLPVLDEHFILRED